MTRKRPNSIILASDALARVADIESRLRSKEGLDIKLAAEEMGICPRTVRRVVEDLMALGIEVHREGRREERVFRVPRSSKRLVDPMFARRLAEWREQAKSAEPTTD